MRFFLILILCVYSIYADVSDLEPLTDEIIKEINALKTTWKAGKNFNGLSSLQIDDLVSTEKNISDYYREFNSHEYINTIPSLPIDFDAREAWPNCTSIGKIYDQTKGYPSWIYTAVGAMADRLCIKKGIRIDVEATIEKIIETSGYSKGYNSANIGKALEYWSKKGIFTVEPVKSVLKDCLPLSQECPISEYKLGRYFVVESMYIQNTDNILAEIMNGGPVPVTMEVYSDFLSYKSGVYHRTSRKLLGYHNVKLIGWGSDLGYRYWLATNSWGTDWGENGLVKIMRSKNILGTVPHPFSIDFVHPSELNKDVPKSHEPGQLFYLAK